MPFGLDVKQLAIALVGAGLGLQVFKLLFLTAREAKFSGRKLEEIPQDVMLNSLLSKADFSNNELKGTLQIGDWPKVKILNVSENMLNELPGQIGNMKALQQLYLQDNVISKLPVEFYTKLTSLKEINLSRNRLVDGLHPDIKNLIHLEELDVSNNPWYGGKKDNPASSVDPQEGGTTTRKTRREEGVKRRSRSLHKAGTGTSQPGSKKGPAEPKQEPGMWKVPGEIGLLKSLRKLNLSGNMIGCSGLPEEMEKLTGLEELDISRTDIRSTPPGFLGKLKAMKIFKVSGNPMKCPFPNFISNFKENLEELRISDADISYASNDEDVVGSLKKLHTLDISGNLRIECLPKGISKMIVLRELYASKTGISYESIMDLCMGEVPLKILDLSGNDVGVKKVAESSQKSGKSDEAELEGDEEEEEEEEGSLPDLIFDFAKTLEELRLADANIKNVDRIDEFTSLKKLVLSGNKELRWLPASIKRLKGKIEKIYLEGCTSFKAEDEDEDGDGDRNMGRKSLLAYFGQGVMVFGDEGGRP